MGERVFLLVFSESESLTYDKGSYQEGALYIRLTYERTSIFVGLCKIAFLMVSFGERGF